MVGSLTRQSELFFTPLAQEITRLRDDLLDAIDPVLDDGELIALVRQRLATRHPRSHCTGRVGIAPTGVRAQSQPVLWRLTYLAAGPVMPLILLARKTRTVFAKRCRVKQFVRALPLTLIALVVFVAGEWVGCLLGPGDALSRVE